MRRIRDIFVVKYATNEITKKEAGRRNTSYEMKALHLSDIFSECGLFWDVSPPVGNPLQQVLRKNFNESGARDKRAPARVIPAIFV